MNMKRITQLIIMSICMTSCVITTDEGLDVLKKLGTQLNQVRALPTGTPTNLRCPEKLDIFKVLKRIKFILNWVSQIPAMRQSQMRMKNGVIFSLALYPLVGGEEVFQSSLFISMIKILLNELHVITQNRRENA